MVTLPCMRVRPLYGMLLARGGRAQRRKGRLPGIVDAIVRNLLRAGAAVGGLAGRWLVLCRLGCAFSAILLDFFFGVLLSFGRFAAAGLVFAFLLDGGAFIAGQRRQCGD